MALWIYCRDIKVNKPAYFKMGGPLLIACNHPNSFLDAIILSTLFDQPVYSLARGDAFASPFYDKLLRSLNMFPVYRVSEGVENLEQNYKTFDDCKTIFKKDGIVLIFSEGRCINEWHLRPLKKGTARLAISSWQQGIPLNVLPVGINYSSYTRFGKNMIIDFGKVITANDIDINDAPGKALVDFNALLKKELEAIVLELDKKDQAKIESLFAVKIPLPKKILLFIPATLGWLLHAPLYYPIKKFTWAKAKDNDHFDSVMIGLLFIIYPFYLLLFYIILSCFIGWLYALPIFILIPFCARAAVQLKGQF